MQSVEKSPHVFAYNSTSVSKQIPQAKDREQLCLAHVYTDSLYTHSSPSRIVRRHPVPAPPHVEKTSAVSEGIGSCVQLSTHDTQEKRRRRPDEDMRNPKDCHLCCRVQRTADVCASRLVSQGEGTTGLTREFAEGGKLLSSLKTQVRPGTLWYKLIRSEDERQHDNQLVESLA